MEREREDRARMSDSDKSWIKDWRRPHSLLSWVHELSDNHKAQPVLFHARCVTGHFPHGDKIYVVFHSGFCGYPSGMPKPARSQSYIWKSWRYLGWLFVFKELNGYLDFALGYCCR